MFAETYILHLCPDRLLLFQARHLWVVLLRHEYDCVDGNKV